MRGCWFVYDTMGSKNWVCLDNSVPYQFKVDLDHSDITFEKAVELIIQLYNKDRGQSVTIRDIPYGGDLTCNRVIRITPNYMVWPYIGDK